MPESTDENRRPQGGLFSPDELRRLMRIEFDRARRHRYDLACLCVAVDRIGHLRDLYGTATGTRIQDALLAIVERSTRGIDYPRGTIADAQVALLPHTPHDAVDTIARRLLEAGRSIELEVDGRRIALTISIGVSGVGDPGVDSFDALLQGALAGLALARAAGGDRWMRGEQVSNEVDQLRRELDELRAALQRQDAAVGEARRLDAVLAGSSLENEAALLERPEDRLLADRLAGLLAASGVDGSDGGRLQHALIAAALRGVYEERRRASDRQLAENRFELDLLRRRVAKLTRTLGATEEELRRVIALQAVDPGVASVYRTVQGLSLGAADAEGRIQMLTRIFEANVDLRRSLAPNGNATS